MSLFLEARADGSGTIRLEVKHSMRHTIGRAEDADLRVEGEQFISRKHAEAWLEAGKLKVRRLAGSSNPLIFRGHSSDEFTGGEFTMGDGDFFVIGKTRFVFYAEREESPDPALDRSPDRKKTIEEEQLYGWGGRSDRLRLIDLLQIPEMLRTMERRQFYAHLVGMLRMSTGGIWACVAKEDGEIVARDAGLEAPLSAAPSKSLVRQAIADAPKPTWYSWSQHGGDIKATMQEGADWAICSAMVVPGEAPLVLYVLGKGGGTGDTGQEHLENCRFVGLVADMVGRSLSVSRLETWHARLKHFFSGPVAAKILDSRDPRELEPRLAESTVMFFDLRGFSRRTEGRNDRILEHLGELRGVMTAMTDRIFGEGGVVLSYMGDGILACWNVPIAEGNHVDRACHAALAMTENLRQLPGEWRCGIGLHTGEVVAGMVGSDQMFSYGVMGGVVNQASRVEGITKVVEVPILVTREVAERVSPDVAVATRIGRFQPAGMESALDLYELTSPPVMPERQDLFSRGLEALEQGSWERAYELLDRLGPGDRPARYLMALAEQYRRRPPRNWAGIIELVEK